MSTALGYAWSRDKVSNDFLNKAWPLQLPPVSKAVLIALADRADDGGIARPGVDDLVTRTCFGRRAVQRAIGDLERAGLIVIGLRKGGFRKQTTIYRLNLPAIATKDEPEITWIEGRTSDATRVSQSNLASDSRDPRPTVADDGLTCARTIIEPSLNHQGTIYEPSPSLRAVASEQAERFGNGQTQDLFHVEQPSRREVRPEPVASKQRLPAAVTLAAWIRKQRITKTARNERGVQVAEINGYLVEVIAEEVAMAADLTHLIQCAPTARFTSGGRIHPGSCR